MNRTDIDSGKQDDDGLLIGRAHAVSREDEAEDDVIELDDEDLLAEESRRTPVISTSSPTTSATPDA